MPDAPRNPTPLPADGTFRGHRLPAALATDYVGVDEYAVSDWVEYVRRIAERVQYYDDTNSANGNWTPFYRGQAAVTVARLLGWPVDRLVRRLSEHRELIEDTDNAADTELLGQLLGSLFDLLSSSVLAFDELFLALPSGSPLHLRAAALIRQQLAPALRRWLAYYRGGRNAGLFDDARNRLPDYLTDERATGGAIMTTQSLLDGTMSLSERWSEGQDWGAYAGAILADNTVYGTDVPGADPNREIVHAVGHVFLHGIYENFTNTLAHLIGRGQSEWERLLTDYAGHAPHVTLLLTYLQVRERQRAMLNGLTDRHLDFYYRRVLRLLPRPPQPARAFLSLELRKGMDPTFLPAGTLFRGGKDEVTKQERLFASTEDLVVNHATVALLRSAHKPAGNGMVYASDAVVPEEAESWHPFDVPDQLPARLGLAIESHYLYLAEGERTVTVDFDGLNIGELTGVTLHLALTTEDGWWETTRTVGAGGLVDFTLTVNDPPTVGYDEEVHELGLTASHPVLRITLPDTPGYRIIDLNRVRLSHIDLSVEVNGVRQLSISGPTGELDPGAAFFPFGAVPTGNESFYIGYAEAFQKEATVTIDYGWKNPVPGGAGTPSMEVSVLEDGEWVRHDSYNELIAGYQTNDRTIDLTATTQLAPATEAAPYSAGSRRGFVRFQLRGDFGHRSYPAALAAWLADERPEVTIPAVIGKGGPPNFLTDPVAYNDWINDPRPVITIPAITGKGPMPEPAFDPELEFISLDYTATTRLTAVTHLTPFGSVGAGGSGYFGMLPRLFPIGSNAADKGALYLGIDHWLPGEQLRLLIQVEEGSADPLLEKPDDHLRWHYLDGNQWEPFPKDKLSDGSDHLLRSGIVRLDLPAGTEAANQRFGDGRQWIRLMVNEGTRAVNYLRGIHAQAIEVVQETPEGFLGSNDPLEAGTIAKLLRPLPPIKTIVQPYPTFGGATVEDRDAYFTRQSERLRHKDRGITEWDVEHLVLGAFPEVERVICLQHLEYSPYRELAAGHVTVLPLGRAGGERANQLRPYVSLTTREDIETFLRARMSCHAVLHVRNPLFEEVRVSLHVRFREGTDETQSINRIQEDLIGFISPWSSGSLAELDLAAEVHRSAVLNFLEELDYVDYVKNLVLYQLADPSQNGSERLRPTKLTALLVAAPTHVVTVLGPTDGPAVGEVCTTGCGTRRSRHRITVEELPE
jgi:hypothetical protein